MLTCKVLLRKEMQVRDLETSHRGDAHPKAEDKAEANLLGDAESHLAEHQRRIDGQVAVNGRRVSYV
jgi:hypothetical protein